MKALVCALLASLAGCSATTSNDPGQPLPEPARAAQRAGVPPSTAQGRERAAQTAQTPSLGVGAAPPPASSPQGAPQPRELPEGSLSTSLGSPTNGRLEHGVALPQAGLGFRHNDRRDANARFGTAEVVRAIARAARAVSDELPGSELVVNDLSLPSGGRIPHHGSHRAGRDADILFYMLGADGAPTPSVGTPLDFDDVGYDFKDLSLPEDDVRVRFDAARTWRFVRALLEDPEGAVQRIFVVEHLRARLLDEAARQHSDAKVVARFADATCQPSYPHDDHLHVRWYCSADDLAQGCEDLPPMYPWHEAELRALGLAPVLTRLVRSSDPAPIVTNEQAEREVKRQKPHPSVLAFLKRRKAWEKQPHPGRPYCR